MAEVAGISRQLLDSLPELLQLVSNAAASSTTCQQQQQQLVNVSVSSSSSPPGHHVADSWASTAEPLSPAYDDTVTAWSPAVAEPVEQQSGRGCWLRLKPAASLLGSSPFPTVEPDEVNSLSMLMPAAVSPPGSSILGKRKDPGDLELSEPATSSSLLSPSSMSGSSPSLCSTQYDLCPTTSIMSSTIFNQDNAAILQKKVSKFALSNDPSAVKLKASNSAVRIDKDRLKKRTKTADLERTLGLINRIMGTDHTAPEDGATQDPPAPESVQQIESIVSDRNSNSTSWQNSSSIVPELPAMLPPAPPPLPPPPMHSCQSSWSGGIVNSTGTAILTPDLHHTGVPVQLAKHSRGNYQPSSDAVAYASAGNRRRLSVRELMRRNRDLTAEVERYAANDRNQLYRERRQLDDYRYSLEKESALRESERVLRKKAEQAAAKANSRAKRLEIKLAAVTAAHDEEVNSLYEQLLSEKQQVLDYCDKVNQLNIRLAELQEQQQLPASGQLRPAPGNNSVKEEPVLTKQEQVLPKQEPEEYIETFGEPQPTDS